MRKLVVARAFTPALLIVAIFGACSAAPDRSAEPAAPAVPAAPVSSQPNPSASPSLPDPEGLSGNWTLVMGKMTWHVPLMPREGLPGEYLGVGVRETPDEEGKQVTMDVGAVKEGNDFRAWLGMGVIKCKGRFRSTGQIKGECIEMGGDAAGPFVAEKE